MAPRLIDAAQFDPSVREKLAQIADEKILKGEIVPSAASDLVMHAVDFANVGGRLVHLDSGLPFDKAVEKIIEDRPHFRPPVYSDLSERAFGSNPSLAARGELLRTRGRHFYELEAARWRADPKTLAPGTVPENLDMKSEPQLALAALESLPNSDYAKKLRDKIVEDARATEKPKTKAGDRRENPWYFLRDTKGKLDPEAQKECAAKIRALGSARAAALARQAGVTLDGRPL